MPAVMMMGGRIFQPCCVRSGWSMSYLSSLWDVDASGNMLLQYVNSNIQILRLALGGGDWWFGVRWCA